jgi:OmpA-OmpF porin, OOP family
MQHWNGSPARSARLRAAPALAGVLALGLGAGATHAMDGVYIGAGYDRAQVYDIGGYPYDLKIDDNAWKAIVGVRPIPFFAVEANYDDLGHQSQPVLGGSAYGHADARAFELYGVGLLPLSNAFDLYAKAGGARWQLSSSFSGDSGTLFALDSNGTSFAWGAGAQGNVGPVGLRLEYTHFQMPDTGGAKLYTAAVVFTF